MRKKSTAILGTLALESMGTDYNFRSLAHPPFCHRDNRIAQSNSRLEALLYIPARSKYQVNRSRYFRKITIDLTARSKFKMKRVTCPLVILGHFLRRPRRRFQLRRSARSFDRQYLR